jgi:hypothetical protein
VVVSGTSTGTVVVLSLSVVGEDWDATQPGTTAKKAMAKPRTQILTDLFTNLSLALAPVIRL